MLVLVYIGFGPVWWFAYKRLLGFDWDMFFLDKKTKIVSAAFAKWLVVGVTLILM